ncbi:3-oxoacyl-ACP reductase FabG [Gordonia hydrophobica]|uniref:3-oxoacyl-ACP reductase FabG n=1 Tax=Gordonia hydrophobica TaxID=40516 RepID=A0ABZ2U555_9ACTN|nr:3-oxoacyl-ACP reductase FabG [Gordonia hydrophobica]MBM7368643.1 3-oxoacyl-[acyl-carrier protein] reductase [Gordonia hydrophobica]
MTESRTAIVTGAARGIGAAVAERLLADGLRVALVDSDADLLESTSKRLSGGGRLCAVVADVRDPDAVDQAVAQTAQELGAPTVLVNNAGYTRDNLLHKMSLDDWDSVMDVHLRAAFMMTRAVQTHMVDAGSGRIVNISSIAALGNRGQVNYSAAKAGVQGFTRTLAIELGRFGVNANAIAPGFIETAMTRATAERMRMTFDDMKAHAEQQIPLGRVGQPTDIADVASFLIGPDSSYVSGQVLYVSGGPTV